MTKRLILIIAAICFLAVPAYAAVQNVRVSGDLTVLGISREDFSLGIPEKGKDTEAHINSIIRLKVDADLTDNVAVTTRLLNERGWDQEGTYDDTDVNIDLAYVTLKEMLYSPLTVMIGRQELKYGAGFIIGDPDTNNQSRTSTLSSFTDQDLSARKAFDAVRAVLDYNPLTIDLVYAKVDENTVQGNAIATEETDDINLWGVNAKYDLGDEFMTTAEAYLFAKLDRNAKEGNAGYLKVDKIWCPGLRVSTSPTERLYLAGEVAWQMGNKVVNSAAEGGNRKREAMATQFIANYALPVLEEYSPSVGLVYSWYSGDKNPANTRDAEGDTYKAWDPMFEDQTSGHIINTLFNATNSSVLDLKGSFKPIEDLTVALDLVMLKLHQEQSTSTLAIYDPTHTSANAAMVTGKRHLGTELDLNLIYDYTEDVQFGLLMGYFTPGNAFEDTNNNEPKTASEVIASCKVNF